MDDCAEKTPSSGNKDETAASDEDMAPSAMKSDESNNRTESPVPGKDPSGRSGSSRRKPMKTHKVVEETSEDAGDNADPFMTMDIDIDRYLDDYDDDEGDATEPTMDTDVLQSDSPIQGTASLPESSQAESKASMNGGEIGVDIDAKGNVILPEGTVMVQPEDVDEKQSSFKGPEFKKHPGADAQGVIVCTACSKQIHTNSINNVKRHPVLQVLICKRCYKWYMSDEIEQDEDGLDNQCRWCGEGGDLLCCDYCHNAFCKGCIRRNLGRPHLDSILDAGEDVKWHCYVCDPAPLKPLHDSCTKLIESVELATRDTKRRSTPPQPHNQQRDFQLRVQMQPQHSESPTSRARGQTARKSTTPAPRAPSSRVPVNRPQQHMASPMQHAMAPRGAQFQPRMRQRGMASLPPPAPPRGPVPMQQFVRVPGGGARPMNLQEAVRTMSPNQLAKYVVQQQQQKHAAALAAQQKAKQSAQQAQTAAKGRSPAGSNQGNTAAGSDIAINEFNVSPVLDRMFAAAQSMNMLLTSLKEELKKAARKAQNVTELEYAKTLVALKLKRAFVAYKKSFVDIENFAQNFQPVKKGVPGSSTGQTKRFQQHQPIPQPGRVMGAVTKVPANKSSRGGTPMGQMTNTQRPMQQRAGTARTAALMAKAAAAAAATAAAAGAAKTSNKAPPKPSAPKANKSSPSASKAAATASPEVIELIDSDEDAEPSKRKKQKLNKEQTKEKESKGKDDDTSEKAEDNPKPPLKMKISLSGSVNSVSLGKRKRSSSDGENEDVVVERADDFIVTRVRDTEDGKDEDEKERQSGDDDDVDAKEGDKQEAKVEKEDEKEEKPAADEMKGDDDKLLEEHVVTESEPIKSEETVQSDAAKDPSLESTDHVPSSEENQPEDVNEANDMEAHVEPSTDGDVEATVPAIQEIDEKAMEELEESIQSLSGQSLPSPSPLDKDSPKGDLDLDTLRDIAVSEILENSNEDEVGLEEFPTCELDVNMETVEALQRDWFGAKLETADDKGEMSGDASLAPVNGDLDKSPLRVSQLDGMYDDISPSSSGGSTPERVEDDAAAMQVALQQFDAELTNSFKYDSRFAGLHEEEEEEEEEDVEEVNLIGGESSAVGKDMKAAGVEKDGEVDGDPITLINGKISEEIDLTSQDDTDAVTNSNGDLNETNPVQDEEKAAKEDAVKDEEKTGKDGDDVDASIEEVNDGEASSEIKFLSEMETASDAAQLPPSAEADTSFENSEADTSLVNSSFGQEEASGVKEAELTLEQDADSSILTVGVVNHDETSSSSSDSLCFEKVEQEYLEKKQKQQVAEVNSKVCVVTLEKLGAVNESVVVKPTRSREDMEAQRLLLKEMMESSGSNDESQDETPVSVSSDSSASDYTPSKPDVPVKKKERRKKSNKSEELSPIVGSSSKAKKKSVKRQADSTANASDSSDVGSKSGTSKNMARSKSKSQTGKKANGSGSDGNTDKGVRKSSRRGGTGDEPVEVDSDEQLEKDVDRLTNMSSVVVRRSKRGQTGKEKLNDDGMEVEEKKDMSKPAGRRIKVGKPRQRDRNILDGLSSTSSEEETYARSDEDVENGPAVLEVEQEDMYAAMDSEDEDARAKMDLLASEDSSDEEDSDIERMALEREAKAKHGGTSGIRSSEVMSDDDDDDDSSDDFNEPKSKPLKRDKLLAEKLTDSDEAPKKSRKTRNSKKKKKGGSEDDSSLSLSSDDSLPKRGRKKLAGKNRGKKKADSESDDSSDSSSDGAKKKKRKRVKMMSESSEDSDDDDGGSPEGKKRKKIRKIIKDKKLSEVSLSAAKAEEERRERIKERQKLYNQVMEEDVTSPTKCPITAKLVLEMDDKEKTLIEVNPAVIRKLKPHQVEAVKFLWDCCCESLERLKNDPGTGCILAHCMGLGKTLSIISFISTLMLNRKKTRINTCLVVCPLNTVLNWQNEFDKWLGEDSMDVYELSSVKNNYGRSDMLESWQEGGGIMIIGYELYRILSMHQRVKNKKQKISFSKCLVKPGPDIVVCDEGHLLKNDSSGMSKALNQIHTRRRVVLTGTPLQNNLVEYHCMVSFVKPGLLGTRKEFLNRFVNPITNGQCSDSTPRDVKLMKSRAHILHETLAGCVQRRDYSALTKFLPPKHEYVITVRMSPLQIQLYEKYLNTFTNRGEAGGPVTKGARLFSDYQNLMKIWTHPWVLKLDEIRQEHKKWAKEGDMDSFLDDTDGSDASYSDHSSDEKKARDVSDDSSSGSGAGRRYRPRRSTSRQKRSQGDKAGTSGVNSTNGDNDLDEGKPKETFAGEIVKKWKTRSRQGDLESVIDEEEEEEVVSTEWWGDAMTKSDQYSMELSGKIALLSEILKMAEAIGDKVLVFSQSLLSLDLIEDFLEHWDSEGDKVESDADSSQEASAHKQRWLHGLDYFRMDGSTSAQVRQNLSETFNLEENTRARLFLISTKAGSLGINLVAANRVIVFDASWNPTHDVQSIFRTYRFGQLKPCYVYRFLAQGTMEEKIYERQVTKLALSSRVIDEHQIERHFTAADLSELYHFQPDRLDDPDRIEEIPTLPKDRMLAELLTNQKDYIVRYHEHDSLLENQIDQELSEEDRKTAWQEYEEEKKGLRHPPQYGSNRGAVGPGYDYNMMLAQMMMGGPQQQQQMYMPPSPHFSMQAIMPDAQSVAQTIYAANPGMTTEELERRVQTFIQQRVASEQHRLLLEQQRAMQQMDHEARLRMEMRRLAQLKENRRKQEESYKNMLSSTSTAQAEQDAASTLRNMLSKP